MTNGLLTIFALAAAVSASGASALDGSEWRLDPSRTRVAFTIDAAGFPRTHGEFHAFKGRLAVDLDRPASSRVAFTVESASIDVGSPAFDGALRGPAFLDASKFPVIAFESTFVEKTGETTARVSGKLTMLGVTRPLDVDVDVRRVAGGERLGFVARARIDRLAFGMNSGYPVISRDVDLEVASEAAR